MQRSGDQKRYSLPEEVSDKPAMVQGWVQSNSVPVENNQGADFKNVPQVPEGDPLPASRQEVQQDD